MTPSDKTATDIIQEQAYNMIGRFFCSQMQGESDAEVNAYKMLEKMHICW